MNQTNKLLCASCYFSIFFAPFLFPVVVYFAVAERRVKYHAKKALLSHLIPFAWFLLVLIFMIGARTTETFSAGIIIMAVGFGIMNIVIVIWNIVKGIQLLAAE